MITPTVVYAGVALIATIMARVIYKVNESKIKGYFGERKVKRNLNRLEKNGEGLLINNLNLLTKDGQSSQLDHVFINRSGIFIVETKNYSGVISGKENDKSWEVSYGHKVFKCNNFAHQNKGHIHAIKPFLEKYPNLPIFSVLSFNPDCDVRLNLVQTIATNYNTLNNAIRVRSRFPVLTEEQVAELYTTLSLEKEKNKNLETTHVSRLSLQQIHDEHAHSMGLSREQLDESLANKYINNSSISLDVTKGRKSSLNDMVSNASSRSGNIHLEEKYKNLHNSKER